MVMVELLLRNLLMTMYFFSDCNFFRSCCDPFDVAAIVVIVVVLFLLQVTVKVFKNILLTQNIIAKSIIAF